MMSHRYVSVLVVAILVLLVAPVTSAQSPSPSPAPSDLTPITTAAPEPSMAMLGPIGADPPLREPVVASEPRERLHTRRTPDARKKRHGVTLETWLPQHTLQPGEWLTAHIRITNGGRGPIGLHCYPTRSRLNVHELFDPGREWTGNAETFKRAVLESHGSDHPSSATVAPPAPRARPGRSGSDPASSSSTTPGCCLATVCVTSRCRAGPSP